MFRIKTDIRHYRCESRDKVERLIRNWVIRPSDLIHDDDTDDWQPIGNHPDFAELFESLDERHENQPETVVTDRVDRKAANDRALRNDSSPGGSSAPGAAVLRKATDDSGPTEVVDSGETDQPPQPPEPSEDVEGVIRDSDEITVMTDRTLSLMQQDVDTGSETSATAGPDEPTGRVQRPPPEQPEGTTPERAGPNEPTALVDHPHPGDTEPSRESATGSADRAGPDEPTARVERPGEDAPESPNPDRQRAGPDEPTALVEHPAEDRRPPKGDPPEATKPAGVDEQTDPVDDDSEADSSRASADPDDEPPSGRHDLPAHLFETADFDEDFERPTRADDSTGRGSVPRSVPRTDHRPEARRLVELDGAFPRSADADNDAPVGISADELDVDPYDETDELDRPDPDEMDVEPVEQTGEPDEPAAGAPEVDPLADTGEIDNPASRKPGAQALDDTDEFDEPDPDELDTDALDDTDELDESDVEEVDALDDTDEFDESDVQEATDTEAEDDEVEEISAVDIDPVDPEEVDDEAVTEGVDPEEADQPAPVEVQPLNEEVYDGYDVDFLIPIEPTERSLQLGIEKSSVSGWTKSHMYPRPEPSEAGEVVTRTWDLEEDSRPDFPLPVSPRTALALAVGVVVLLIVVVVVLT